MSRVRGRAEVAGLLGVCAVAAGPTFHPTAVTGNSTVRSVGLLLFHDMQDSLQTLVATANAQGQDPAGLAALSQLLDRIETELPGPLTDHLVQFVRHSKRGICREGGKNQSE